MIIDKLMDLVVLSDAQFTALYLIAISATTISGIIFSLIVWSALGPLAAITVTVLWIVQLFNLVNVYLVFAP
jgi:hypothetical protein